MYTRNIDARFNLPAARAFLTCIKKDPSGALDLPDGFTLRGSGAAGTTAAPAFARTFCRNFPDLLPGWRHPTM